MESEEMFKQTEIGNIPKDWDISKVEDIARINEGAITKTFPYDEIEYIDIDSVENGIIRNVQRIRLKEAPSRAKRIVKSNDIIISTVRPNLKHFALINQSKPNTIVSTGFAVISAQKVNPKFLYYYLTTEKYTNYLTAIADAHTSAYPSFNPDVIENSLVPLPGKEEQDRIAKILFDIDTKIELNQQINKNLEAIGRALFKHWFIDFEFPNEKGKPYKSSSGEMVDSDLGEIPKGWEKGSVSDLVNHSKDTISLYDSPEKIFFHYSIPSYDEGKWPSMEKGNFIKSNKFLVKSNSILVSKLNPRMPRIWAVGEVDESCSVCSTEFQVLVPKKKWNYNYVYFSFNSGEITDEMKSLVTGTSSSHQRVRPEDMLNLKIVIPDEDVLQKFEDISFCLRQKMWQIDTENKHLCSIHDALLPKLMSGQIRVPVG